VHQPWICRVIVEVASLWIRARARPCMDTWHSRDWFFVKLRAFLQGPTQKNLTQRLKNLTHPSAHHLLTLSRRYVIMKTYLISSVPSLNHHCCSLTPLLLCLPFTICHSFAYSMPAIQALVTARRISQLLLLKTRGLINPGCFQSCLLPLHLFISLLHCPSAPDTWWQHRL
jgi:hypothetical protein